VSVLHGAPLRLRCENELGFKMVKWIAASSSFMTSRTLAPVKADITKIMNSTGIECQSEVVELLAGVPDVKRPNRAAWIVWRR